MIGFFLLINVQMGSSYTDEQTCWVANKLLGDRILNPLPIPNI